VNAQRRISAKNQTARLSLIDQLRYRAAGNPPSTVPDAAISNCFPGLEFDFRNIWRHILDGIELHEATNLVVGADPERPALKRLVGHRLLYVDHHPTFAEVLGPKTAGKDDERLPDAIDGVAPMEWSNALAEVMHKSAGKIVPCWFTGARVDGGMGVMLEGGSPASRTPAKYLKGKPAGLVEKMLRVNRLFATNRTGSLLPVIDERLVGPGELTQSLCSPWQNDYRECACYYWAATRPDYVNVEDSGLGETAGNHWLAKNRQPKQYVADDSSDARLWSYDDLFRGWQEHLRFVIGGKDAEEPSG
jgi:hypothetical protein